MQPHSRFARIIVKLVGLVLVLALFAISLPKLNSVQAATCSTTYTVVAGDTLSAIALKYNTTVQELATANNLKEPYTLTIGQKICITGSSTTASTTPSSTTPTATSSKTFFTASFSGKFVTIKTNNYPKKNFYSVNGFLPYKPDKYILGYLRTTSATSVQQTYQLHKDLRNSKRLTICLKDLVFDNAQCNFYVRQAGVYYLSFSWITTYTVPK